jgi:hypothetical protein
MFTLVHFRDANPLPDLPHGAIVEHLLKLLYIGVLMDDRLNSRPQSLTPRDIVLIGKDEVTKLGWCNPGFGGLEFIGSGVVIL